MRDLASVWGVGWGGLGLVWLGTVYKQRTMPEAILEINFLRKNNVVINLAEGRFEMRRDGSNCERKFCYDPLPNDQVAVDHISTPELQPRFPESKTTKQTDGKE